MRFERLCLYERRIRARARARAFITVSLSLVRFIRNIIKRRRKHYSFFNEAKTHARTRS